MPRFQYISGKRRVFVKLRQKREISRAELARQCGLTRPAVSAIIEELIADGYVRETGIGRSTGGKPPIMLEFCPRSRCAIGIDLGRDGKIEGVLCDLGGNVIASEQLPCENDFEAILNSCVAIVKSLPHTAMTMRSKCFQAGSVLLSQQSSMLSRMRHWSLLRWM